ncbi:MAG TPA: hypothetical protein VL283_02710 [Candidatus Baltobacteraceae bacterium]|nr:hypothetical protein [Candidatus Baltobacteraceae bacterium]
MAFLPQRTYSRWTLVLTALGVFVVGGFYLRERAAIFNEGLGALACAATTANVALPFKYPFSVDGRLEEVGVLENSSSPYWWVSSGAFLDLKGGLGRTNQGDLGLNSKWQLLYNKNNPIDTDGGLHPQNIFRMTTRAKWQDASHEIFYRIDRNQLSASVSRNASNGLLQMTRYVDQNNLYYTGLRVDGYAVIKKKIGGKYYTMYYKPYFNVVKKYDRLLNPNLLPLDTWIGLKTVTKNLDASRVSITFYSDVGRTGTWTQIASVIDDGKAYGGPALTAAGVSGLRTDFMDVSMDDFAVTAAP